MTLLEKHVAACPRCRSRLERERRLRSVARIEESPPADASVVYTFMSSPLGTLWIAEGREGIISIAYATDEAAFCARIEAMGHDAPWFDRAGLPRLKNCLTAYFRGKRTEFRFPIDLGRGSPFRQAVLQAVMRIPYGETRTYGEIAAEVGAPRAARAVGTVMAGNEIAVLVPCHRVVRADGMTASYGINSLGPCGIQYKAALLGLETKAIRNPVDVL